MSTLANPPAELTASQKAIQVAKYLLHHVILFIHACVHLMTLAIKGAIAGAVVMTGYFLYSANPDSIQFSDFLFMLHTQTFVTALIVGAVAWVLLYLPLVDLTRP